MARVIDNYIANLARDLLALPKDQQQDTLTFYRDFLIDGDFQTKEEIAKELGSTKELAKAILADYQHVADHTAPKSTKRSPSDNYVRGFHLEKNPSRLKTIPLTKFTKIKLNLRNADIFIHSGNNYQAIVTDYSSRPISTHVEQHTLTITEQPPKKGNNLLVINWRTAASRVEITIPKKILLSTISGNNMNGNVTLQNLQLTTIDLKQNNGNTLFNNVQTKKIILNSKNGSLDIAQTKINTAKFNASNGNVNIKRSMLNQVALQSFNGSISFIQCNLTMKLNTKNGNITISSSQLTNENIINSHAGDLFLKHLAPDISYKLVSKHGNIFYHKSCVGRKLASSVASNDTLQIVTTDGDITIC